MLEYCKVNVEIKKTVKAGNSSAVILPKAWLDKEVRVELIKKTHETMLQEVINIVKEDASLEEIIGVYLVGSYARGEEDRNSDVDILVISANTDIEMISKGIYNIFFMSEGLLKWKLESDLFPIGQMIREARPLINASYLKSIKIEVTEKNVRWYLDTTKKKLDLIEKILALYRRERVSDKVAYSLILRARTLYIMQKLILNHEYSKKDFKELIAKVSGSNNTYNAYLSVKAGLEDTNNARKEETEKLYFYLRKQLERVIRLIGH